MDQNKETLMAATPNAPMNGVVQVEQQRAIAEVQAAILMARNIPRDTVRAMGAIKLACQRPALAEVATYSYPRGAENVTGPSIRLAEAVAQQWGNMQFGIRELSQANGESTVEAYAWDMEGNVRVNKVFQVPHIRYTKAGTKRLTDPRDIYELVANNGARRLRACILGVIPGDVIEMAVAECDKTVEVNVQLNEAKINALAAAFVVHGVTKEMLSEWLQRPIEQMTPAQYLDLVKKGNSLKDGIAKAADWFKMPPMPETTVGPVRITTKNMAYAKEEVEKGVCTVDDVLAKNPNAPADQVAEIRTWKLKDAD